MFEPIQITFFIAIGSILGAILRMEFVNKIEDRFKDSFLGIYLINNFATFLLGYLVALERLNDNTFYMCSFPMSFKIGFIGSFSTFSSFALEAFRKFSMQKYIDAFYLVFISILTALIMGLLGYKIGYST